MLITEILARNARMYAAETALVERDPANGVRREITWHAFDAQANRLARALMAKGIAKGDRVVQLMMNSLEWLPVYFGILRTGAWAVPLNFRFVAKTIGRCTRTAGARGIIFGPEFIERLQTLRNEPGFALEFYIFIGPESLRPAWAESGAGLLAAHEPDDPRVPIEITDEAALYFT
ncbi:MAG: AMP-binding protein, partial [Desulfobacteraceae bacterium]